MKMGIFFAMAALALAVFVVPEAQGNSGPDLDQRLSGSVFTVDVDEEADGNTTSLVNAIAKGQPGKARVTAVLVFKTVFAPNDGCDINEGFFGSEIVSFDFVETYNDGSLLAGSADPDQVLCGNQFETVAELTGTITGGTGRFEGASGTWEAEASSPLANNIATGSITADLN